MSIYRVDDAPTNWHGTHLGFVYDGVHSASLNVVRVSSSDRYNDNLLPNFSDKTIQVPGNDGTYYFGTNYTQREFQVEIAFDNLNEEQLRRLRNLVGSRTLKPLIFDEMPYKVYMVKSNGTPNLKYIAFDDGNGGRIYKGEGTLNFIAYFPFARSRFKYLDQYNLQNIPEWENNPYNNNTSEWVSGSGIEVQGYHDKLYANALEDIQASSDQTFTRTDQTIGAIYTNDIDPTPTPVSGFISQSLVEEVGNGTLYAALEGWVNNMISDIVYELPDGYIVTHEGIITTAVSNNTSFILTYNPGDIDTNWTLCLPKSLAEVGGYLGINDTDLILAIQPFQLNAGDAYLLIDSKSNLLIGLDSSKNKTNNIYNAAVLGGQFFKIPTGACQFTIVGFGISSSSTSDTWAGELNYDYLYY